VATGGTVALGFAVALPSGRMSHLSATVSLATVSGTWTDSDARTGPFFFTVSSTGGGARPEPAAAVSITTSQFSPAIYAGTGAATTVARSDHDHDSRYYTRAEIDARRPKVGFANSAALLDITNATVVGQVDMVAPVAGTIVAHGVTTIIDGTATEYSCSVSTTGLWEIEYAQFVNLATAEAVIAVTRHFAVPAGTHGVTLVCDSTGGGSGSALRPKLSVTFIPS
jgi:hypothetical protein